MLTIKKRWARPSTVESVRQELASKSDTIIMEDHDNHPTGKQLVELMQHEDPACAVWRPYRKSTEYMFPATPTIKSRSLEKPIYWMYSRGAYTILLSSLGYPTQLQHRNFNAEQQADMKDQ